MKIIHCADLHLDSKMESNLNKEKARERRDELSETFAAMVDYALNNDVGIIIIAGDLFDTSENMQLRIKRRVLSIIKNARVIDFIYLKGNHDSGEFFAGEEKPDNLKLFCKEEWKSYEYGRLVITGRELPLGKQSAKSFLNPENEVSENKEEDQEEAFYGSLNLPSDKTNIVVLHGQESRYSGKNDAGIINLKLLKDKNIDYLALGHIHSYKLKRLDKRGVYCYSGCLEGRGFDECGKKGFVLLELDEASGKLVSEFIPFAKRELHEVEAELSGSMSEEETEAEILEKLNAIPEKDLVKIIITGEVEESVDIDLPYLTKRLENKFYFLKIYDETRLAIRYEEYENDISLKGEFIRLVREKRLKEEEKREIILTGLRALSGRETDVWK